MKRPVVVGVMVILAVFTLTSMALAVAAHHPGSQTQMGSQTEQTQPPAGQPPVVGGPGMMGPGMMGQMMPMMEQMMGASQDPQTMGLMLQMRGEMMKAIGEVLIKYGKMMTEAAEQEAK